jgi:hypothetical protein
VIAVENVNFIANVIGGPHENIRGEFTNQQNLIYTIGNGQHSPCNFKQVLAIVAKKMVNQWVRLRNS